MQLSPERMAEIYGFADAGSYLRAAQDLIAHGSNTADWAWVLNLWPPGMVWLDAAVIRLSPLDYGVTIGLTTAIVWSVALSILTWQFMRSLKAIALVLATEFAILGTSPFQSWMLDEGLFYADGLAAGFFLIGLGLFANRMRTAGAPIVVWIRDGIFAGIAFACAIYLRASYNLVPWALGLVAAIILVVLVARRVRSRPLADIAMQAVMVVTAAISILILMQPYATFVQQDRNRTQFVQTENLVYEHVWEDRNRKAIPQWMLDGGSTVGCDIAPAKCADLGRQSAAGVVHTPEELRDDLIQAILANPVAFVGNRMEVVTRQWFADEISSYSRQPANYESGQVTYGASYNLNPGQGLLYAGLLCVAFGVAIALAVRGRWALLLLPILALAVLAPFSIVHVEVRYLIPLKMIGLLAPMLLLILHGGKGLRPPGEGIRS